MRKNKIETFLFVCLMALVAQLAGIIQAIGDY